jgi:hypothetical protein
MNEPTFFGSILTAVPLYFYWAVWGLTHVGCAYFIYQSAIYRKRRALNIGAGWWVIFALFGGLLALALYWLMEHSSFAQDKNDEAP